MAAWTMKSAYTYGRRFRSTGLEEAVATVTEAFKATGFGLPPGTTDIRFDKIFAGKGIDPNFRPSHVLGFCHPHTAHQVLLQEPSVGVLLPCNVVVAACDEPGVFEVAAVNPRSMLEMMAQKEDLMSTMLDVDEKIRGGLSGLPEDPSLDQFAW